MMNAITEMTIKIMVDNVPFEVAILPDGRYKILGPLWGLGGLEREQWPVFAEGKLGYGFAFTGLERSITELIKLKLKT